MSGSLIVNWPVSLPDCPNTWTEKPLPAVIRSDVQVGQAKTRRRYTRNRLTAQCSFILERGLIKGPSQNYNTFTTFYNADCMMGARPFTFRHPWSKVLLTWRWLEEPSLADHDVKFFQVTCSWEQL